MKSKGPLRKHRTVISKFRLRCANKGSYFTFSAECDDSRFTIFYDNVGYKHLMSLYSRGVDTAQVDIEWKTVTNKYNKCCKLKFYS